ncbi:ABC transporter permease [Lichenifustis flavocetrariae]|uniref:ABC transporter permease n=1 Tax=Lichenifustis flavocetrariae TaxID=2949735 RepID=A0AA42CPZ6_9HYPH|nr:ABC transporter permease [Lichenifustis flavocetrariae]MCW6510940.1 ABC transporter permease [Lichenifustis flavocetrariae]
MTAPSSTLKTSRLSGLLGNRALLTLGIVIAVWIVASLTSRGFGTWGHLRYLIELAAVIGVVAAGQTLVMIGGGIDLSVGAVITVTAVGVPLLSIPGDATGLGAIAAILGITTAIGIVNGAGIAYLRVHPMIMTLAMATFLQGALILLAGGSAVSVDNAVIDMLGNARPCGIPASVLFWIAVALVTVLMLRRTRFGARVYALGANPLASALSGVNVPMTTLALYGFSGLMAGLAGLLALGMNGQGYVGIGDPYVLMSIAAVVLGGTSILGGLGGYAGTVPGAVLLVTISGLITVVNASAGWRSVLFGVLILGLLLLSGREAARR